MSTFRISKDKEQIIQKISYGEKYLIQGEAGTGKTLLGLLIGKNLLTNIKSTQRILYLTFSKLAKWQIKNSISLLKANNLLTKEDIQRLEIHNFNSFWWDHLKRFRAFLGINKTPTILLEIELNKFSKQSLTSIPLGLIPDKFLTQRGEINKKKEKELLKIFQGEGLIFSTWNPNSFGKYGKLFDGSNEFITEVKKLIIQRNINGYFSHTETVYWIDKLLKHHKNIFNLLKYHFPIIIIDEFQDTDITQWSIIQRLNPPSIIVFADKKQTIHQWRGADPYRIEKFCKKYEISKENIFHLVTRNRYKTKDKKPPLIENISLLHTPLNDRVQLNTAKKSAKFHCKKLALEALEKGKNLAILCRTNNQADEFTDFLRDNNGGFPGFKCERLGSENSPFEIAREILLNLIQMEIREDYINYISNDFYYKIFPENDKCSNRSRKPHLRKRYNDSVNVYRILNENFFYGLKKLVDILYEYENIKSWKSNHSILNCIKFISNQIQRISLLEWKDLNLDQKRNLIDSLILRYENIILSSLPSFSISIMTAHQSKSREFDWVLIPWYSSVAWNYKEGRPWDRSLEVDQNLFHTVHTRAISKFYIIETSQHLPKTENNNNQIRLNNFF